MDAFNTLNEILVKLFNDIMDIEHKAIITGDFKNISNNDMHIIEAIGKGTQKNMSMVAKSLSVTVGTLTIAINSLVKKGYVSRVRSEEDRRVVLLSLTEKGLLAFEHHRLFHEKMIQGIMEGLSEEEIQILVKALVNLKEYFRSFNV